MNVPKALLIEFLETAANATKANAREKVPTTKFVRRMETVCVTKPRAKCTVNAIHSTAARTALV